MPAQCQLAKIAEKSSRLGCGQHHSMVMLSASLKSFQMSTSAVLASWHEQIQTQGAGFSTCPDPIHRQHGTILPEPSCRPVSEPALR